MHFKQGAIASTNATFSSKLITKLTNGIAVLSAYTTTPWRKNLLLVIFTSIFLTACKPDSLTVEFKSEELATEGAVMAVRLVGNAKDTNSSHMNSFSYSWTFVGTHTGWSIKEGGNTQVVTLEALTTQAAEAVIKLTVTCVTDNETSELAYNVVLSNFSTEPSQTIDISSISSDTGESDNDFITADNDGLTITAILSGALQTNQIVEYSNDNVNWGDITSSVDGKNISYLDNMLTSSRNIYLRLRHGSATNNTSYQYITIDNTAPTIDTISVNPGNSDISITFSEEIYFDATDILIVTLGDTPTTVSVSDLQLIDNTSYKLNMTSAITTDSVKVTPIASAILDLAGNAAINNAQVFATTFSINPEPALIDATVRIPSRVLSAGTMQVAATNPTINPAIQHDCQTTPTGYSITYNNSSYEDITVDTSAFYLNPTATQGYTLTIDCDGKTISKTFNIVDIKSSFIAMDNTPASSGSAVLACSAFTNNTTRTYYLVEDISCPAGFSAAGVPFNFKGILYGNGHKVTGLNLSTDGDSTTDGFVWSIYRYGDHKGTGLFSKITAYSHNQTVAIYDLNIIAQQITATSGTAGSLYVGILAGYLEGLREGSLTTKVIIDNVFAAGTVETSYSSNTYASLSDSGGLVGAMEYAYITKSAAAVDITSVGTVGGLVGAAKDRYCTERVDGCASIDTSNAAGTIQTTGTGIAGGVVGRLSYSHIRSSHAAVKVTGEYIVGGLVGEADYHSDIYKSYATGEVKATNQFTNPIYLGGLVGKASFMNYIKRSYATGKVVGIDNYYNYDNTNYTAFYAGALVGWAKTSYIKNTYATGDIEFENSIESNPEYPDLAGNVATGSLVGYAEGSANYNSDDNRSFIKYSYATGEATGGIIGEIGHSYNYIDMTNLLTLRTANASISKQVVGLQTDDTIDYTNLNRAVLGLTYEYYNGTGTPQTADTSVTWNDDDDNSIGLEDIWRVYDLEGILIDYTSVTGYTEVSSTIGPRLNLD
jgi:hypothetical protein